jgi:predicted AAA+ superfamily ATPase
MTGSTSCPISSGWSRNLSNRAVSTAKLAFVDAGIAANLLAADARSLIRPGGPFGPLLEGFVHMELPTAAHGR